MRKSDWSKGKSKFTFLREIGWGGRKRIEEEFFFVVGKKMSMHTLPVLITLTGGFCIHFKNSFG